MRSRQPQAKDFKASTAAQETDLLYRTKEERQLMARSASSCRQSQISSPSVSDIIPATPRTKRVEVPSASIKDERHQSRFECQLAVQMRELTPTTNSLITMMGGVVTDMSDGGMCIRTTRPLTSYSSVRCEITLPNSSISVPTLMQVRWVRQTGTRMYDCGLAYLV